MGSLKVDKTSRPLVMVVVAAWTVLIAASLVWNLHELRGHVIETARTQAEMAYNKNIIYRRWNTEHGGVYVEVKGDIQPNPYLSNIPERDITTPSGKMLTLINPALMMRKVYELTKTEYGINERLISLTPLNPENMPDPWETEALKSIERGENADGVSMDMMVGGVEQMRFVRPLITEKNCLVCHEGYSEGDVQGAISIMLPMKPLRAAAHRSMSTFIAAHILLWLIGSGAIMLVALRLRRAELDRMQLAEELLKSQKLESLGILAGGIAHDYNNLLTAVMANISLAELAVDPDSSAYRKQPEDAVLESLRDAGKATLRAKELTQHLITFSKGGAPVKEPVSDIGGLIRDSVGFALTGSNVSCDVSIPGGLYTVDINTGQINQVLQNIIINAAQAMPEGGVVEVAAENAVIDGEKHLHIEPGEYLRISIKDSGTGIPQENLSRIFDPYFTTKAAGSGLGLATAYSIIKKHGGHISVESEVGTGTTFTVYLPRSEKVAPVEKKKAPAPAPAPGAGIGRVLIMDDEDLVRNAACRILAMSGYVVDQAKDGAEAIELYKEAMSSDKPYDAVITDLTVPGGMGGKEAVAELVKIDPDATVIVSSGYSDDPIIVDFKAYGFKAAILKPYNSEELRSAVHGVIS